MRTVKLGFTHSLSFQKISERSGEICLESTVSLCLLETIDVMAK
ncbi:MAG: hypothetical protein U9N04_01875 [Patescibacteria group bacterium]|nr:hypothetical protein [Patescibacteria group bacterium]